TFGLAFGVLHITYLRHRSFLPAFEHLALHFPSHGASASESMNKEDERIREIMTNDTTARFIFILSEVEVILI
ncbi:hypothetical protein HID58_004816, partial [Brassica napus]